MSNGVIDESAFYGAPALKIVVVGDAGVGKTSLIGRYVNDTFHHDLEPTIGVDFLQKRAMIDDSPFNLQLWDTAGQERFRTLTTSYYRNAVAVIIIYDIACRDSFDNVSYWYRTTRSNALSKAIVGILAHKSDLIEDSTVELAEVRKLAEMLQGDLDPRTIFVAQASSLTGEGVSEVFETAIRRAVELKVGERHERTKTTSVEPSGEEPPRRKCCSTADIEDIENPEDFQ